MSSGDMLQKVNQEFSQLQSDIVKILEDCDGNAFTADTWQYQSGGGGKSMVIENGQLLEKAGVNFSSIKGSALPKAATERRPELIDCEFHATGVSVVIHPDNPHVPTAHANVRFFIAETEKGTVWWFGGGFDLTPYYPYLEDCIFWHRQAKAVCDKYDTAYYLLFKEICDKYFYIKHRDEHRGIGGLFFDDFNELGFESSFALAKDIGYTFIHSYREIVRRRRGIAFSKEQKDFQCYRRGRYAEFNLVYDRGTLFGLQSGGRTESILMSLPPKVLWQYNKHFAAGSAEAALTDYYLKPRNWAEMQADDFNGEEVSVKNQKSGNDR